MLLMVTTWCKTAWIISIAPWRPAAIQDWVWTGAVREMVSAAWALPSKARWSVCHGQLLLWLALPLSLL